MIQKVIKAFPPNFKAISERFPVKGIQGIIYSWGDRIYNPSGVEIKPWLRAHEAVHGQRQLPPETKLESLNETAVKIWWTRYLYDAEFRLAEEIPAHQAEWQAYLGQGVSNRLHYLQQMAERLSGPLYGNLVTLERAKELITE